jgi:hypothetical protein
MMSLQKMGGMAALFEAAAYVLGMVFFLFVVNYPQVVDPAQKVALLAEHQASLHLVTLVIYVVFGVFLVILALALHERLQAGAPAMMQAATVFGLLWAFVVIAGGMVFIVGMNAVVGLYGQDPAQAATVWLAVETVFQGLGGGVEIVGGLWVLLVSWVALRTGGLPRGLNYLGVVVGLAGLLTAVPALEVLGAIFGLSQIVWFTWLGIVLLRNRPGATSEPSDASVPRQRATSILES